MVSVSGGGASFSPFETLEEKREKEKLEAEQSKKEETRSDTQSAVSAAQNSKEQTELARTSLPGTNRITQSSDTTSDTTPKKEANPASQEPKKPSIQLFDTVPTDPARSATQQHEVDEAIKSFQAEKKANDQKVKELDQRLVEMQDQIGKYNELTIKTKDRKYDSLRAVESQKLHALKDSEEYKQAQEKKAQIKARENLISSLIQAGDLKGAKAVAEGKEHTKETEINLQNLQLSPTPPHPEHQNLPPALGQVLDFKKNLDEDIKSRKENLQLLRSQHEELIKGIRHQGIGSVPIEQITKLKEDIAQETRELETRNQVQERIAKLIDEGNIEEAQKLVTGKEKLKVKEIFNKDIKDTSSLDKKSSESVQEMLIKKAVELEKREKEIKQLDIDGNKLKEQIGSLQEKIEATQKDYERSLGYSRKEGYSYETNKSKELAKQKQALKENLQKAQNELKKNTDRSRALNQSAREDLLNLVDAAKLAQQGELDTAKNLINGKTQKQNEILNITNESTNGLINPDKERELGTDKYNQELSQNFRDLILDQIQAQQKQLVILNNYMKDAQRVLDDPSIPDRKITVDIPGKNPGDPPQKKETMLREHIRSEMMASEIKRRELQKSANQLQQLHTKLTELQSQGDFTTTRSIIEGKQSIVTEQIYGAKDADLEATASKDYARTPQESEDLSKKLLVEMTKAHQSALSRLQNAKASELPQEQIKQAQDEEALAKREITHINELIKSNNFEEAIDFSRKHLPLRQSSRETFTQNAYTYFNQERESFEKWDYAYGVGETVSKTAGYVAVGAAAAAATGGVALAYGAGYGTLLLAVGAGTAAGTSAGAVLEAGRAGVAMMPLGGSHTADEAFEGYLGKVGEHAQNALIDSIGTATGLKVAQVLTKPGASTLLKITANAAGGLAESGTSFTINTGISRYQAQEEYERTKPEISYEEFLKQKGLDNASLVKNGLVDMAVSTIIGAKTGSSQAIEDATQAAQRAIGRELADSAQKQARRELTDHGFSLATELTGDFIKNGGSFSVEGVTQAILGAPVETLTSQIRAKVANRNNNNNTNADTQTSSQTKRNSEINPTITEDPNLTVDAQTRRLESADGSQVKVEISARPEIVSPTTKEARAKLAEEYIHAQQQNIDSFETNPDGSIKTDAQGKPVAMDKTENLARRSLNELRARLAGQYDSLTRDLESTTDVQKQADIKREIENTIIQQGEKLNQLESLIADASQKKESGAKADFTKALEFAKNNGITEADINLFLDDYQKNSSRNLDSDQLINRYNSSGLKDESLDKKDNLLSSLEENFQEIDGYAEIIRADLSQEEIRHKLNEYNLDTQKQLRAVADKLRELADTKIAIPELNDLSEALDELKILIRESDRSNTEALIFQKALDIKEQKSIETQEEHHRNNLIALRKINGLHEQIEQYFIDDPYRWEEKDARLTRMEKTLADIFSHYAQHRTLDDHELSYNQRFNEKTEELQTREQKRQELQNYIQNTIQNILKESLENSKPTKPISEISKTLLERLRDGQLLENETPEEQFLRISKEIGIQDPKTSFREISQHLLADIKNEELRENFRSLYVDLLSYGRFNEGFEGSIEILRSRLNNIEKNRQIVNDILEKYAEESDKELARIALAELTQFSSARNLKSLRIKSPDNKINFGNTVFLSLARQSLTTSLQYFQQKGLISNELTIHEVIQDENGFRTKKRIEENPNIAILVDQATLQILEEHPNLRNYLNFCANQTRARHPIIVLPEGLEQGNNPLIQRDNLEELTYNAVLRAQELQKKERLSPKDAVNQALHEQTLNRLGRIGMTQNITYLTNGNKNKIEAEQIASSMSPYQITEDDIKREIETYFPKKITEEKKMELQKALGEFINRNLRIITPKEFSEMLKTTAANLRQYLEQKNTSINDVYFYAPNGYWARQEQKHSMSFITNLFATEYGIDPSKVIIGDARNLRSIPADKTVVILDDFSGSGKTLIETISTIRSQKINFKGNILISPLTITSDAIFNINAAIAQDHKTELRFAEELTKATETSYFKSLNATMQELFINLLGKQGFHPEGLSFTSEESRLGNNCSVVFPYMSPNNNNTLTLVFANMLLPPEALKNRPYLVQYKIK